MLTVLPVTLETLKELKKKIERAKVNTATTTMPFKEFRQCLVDQFGPA